MKIALLVLAFVAVGQNTQQPADLPAPPADQAPAPEEAAATQQPVGPPPPADDPAAPADEVIAPVEDEAVKNGTDPVPNDDEDDDSDEDDKDEKKEEKPYMHDPEPHPEPVKDVEKICEDEKPHYQDNQKKFVDNVTKHYPAVPAAPKAEIFTKYDLSDLVALASKYLDLEGIGSASGLTLFLPTDAAFTTFFQEAGDVDVIDVAKVLAYHVSPSYVAPEEGDTVVVESILKSEGLDGGFVSIVSATADGVSVSFGLGAATVEESFVIADGIAIVHIIDTVLQIPVSPSETAVAAELTSLVDALTAADLVDAVDTAKKATIFAPTNEAFDAVGEVDPDALAGILTYHVIAEQAVGYSPVLTNTEITTLEGRTVSIEVTDDGVTVNGVNVVTADVVTSNGVVHVIDAVLDPEDGGQAAVVTDAASTLVVGFCALMSLLLI